jgi:hypothetical protein
MEGTYLRALLAELWSSIFIGSSSLSEAFSIFDGVHVKLVCIELPCQFPAFLSSCKTRPCHL